MRKILIIIMCIICALTPLQSLAQTEYPIPENVPANNGELDWLIYKDRTGEARTDKKEIILKSKTKSFYVANVTSIQPSMTYAKVPLNFNGDFYLSATMKPAKLDDKHLFGMVFSVSNESDYNAILFDDQFCYVVRVSKLMNITQIQGMENRVRYKYQKAPKGMWKISMERKNGGDFVFSLNGLEIMTYPGSTPFSFESIGACVTNQGEVKITEVSFEQWGTPVDDE